MKTIQQALKEQTGRLVSILKHEKQAWFEAELLLAHVLKKSRIQLATHSDQPIKQSAYQSFIALINRRRKQEPMAYLLGYAPFFQETFFVDKRVLIPRPESEWLVERSLKRLDQGSSYPIIWDVGTGSGIIALSIKKHRPEVHLIASDISKNALLVAKRNARRLHIEGMRFFQGSLLTQQIAKTLHISTAPSFLIIANLPYLPPEDRPKMKPQVIKYEPGSALFAPDHGSGLSKQLLAQLANFHRMDQRPIHILIEFDPPQAISLKRFAQHCFPSAHVTLYPDFNQKKRFLEIYSNPAKIRSSVVT